MRQILFVITLFAVSYPINALAKPASAIWYLLSEASHSIHEDDNLSIEYEFYSKYYAEPELGSVPIPTINIKITNKSGYNIFIDLQDSYIIRSNNGTSIYSSIICISAHDTKTVHGIPVFIPGCENIMGNLFYFRDNICFSRKISSLECGDVKAFDENNTLFTIGGYISYSFDENMTNTQSIQTIYYVSKMIGSKWNKLSIGIGSNPSAKEFKEVDKVFPQWRNGEYKVVRLWAL